MFKRRKEKRTNYKKRLSLLKGEKPRLVIKRNLNYIHIQFIKYDTKGDTVLVEQSSKNLRQYDWKGHYGNLPSAYLTGLLAGLTALGKGVKEAILDIGLQTSIKGNAIYAAALGIKDSGIKISISQDFPKERIEGKHIADYATKLKKEDAEKYSKQFSDYVKKGLEPEKLPEHFTEVKNKILEGFKKTEPKKEGDK